MKLAVVVLLVVAGCTRQVVVASTPGVNTPGGATPRDAVERFMAAAKAQDLQAFGNVWGTSAGPARETLGREELEQREIILMCYLKHDSYTVLTESPAANSERVLALEVKFRDLTRTSNFFTTRGPANRWFVRQFGNEELRDICSRR